MSDAAAFLLAILSGLGMLLIVLPPLSAGARPRRRPHLLPKIATETWSTGLLGAVLCGGGAASIFGFGPVALAASLFGLATGLRATKRLHEQRSQLLRDVWPQLLDTVRVDLTLTRVPLGDAFFAATARLAPPLQERFVAAERVWVNTVDFPAALRAVAATFDDPFTDVVCESLRTVASVPATQMNRRLIDLAADMRTLVGYARDADATLAGARFARKFVVIVPVVMAAVGVWVGDGRAAYQTPTGQLVGITALTVMIGCWWWAGRLLTLPSPPRVFAVKARP